MLHTPSVGARIVARADPRVPPSWRIPARLIPAVALTMVLGAHVTAQLPPGATTTRVSVASDGGLANSDSAWPSLSEDGRYVAFQSDASNLVAGDANARQDVFVHDRQTGQTTLVSVASDGTQGDDDGYRPALSADGRYVVFDSAASNLVAGDVDAPYATSDAFVHDRQTGQTTMVSVASDGTKGNDVSMSGALSADGRYVGFYSYAANLVAADTNLMPDVFVHDRQTGQTTLVSVASNGTQGNEPSGLPALSADGRHVAFESYASNLVAGDTNSSRDVFLHDRQTARTIRVSVASDGAQGNAYSEDPALSADGQWVTFTSRASNLGPPDTNADDDIFVAGPLPVVTDDPVTAATVVKRVHIAELRTRIDALRARYALAAFAWTDPTLTAGATHASAVHVVELRTALSQVYAAAGWVPPTYTDPTVVAGVTVIKAVHITELRAAVVAIE